MTEPQTEAGRRLRQWLLFPDRSYAPHEIAIHAANLIADIEREAREQTRGEPTDWEEGRADLATRIEAIHQPTKGMGYRDDNTYGSMEPVCSECGTADEYGVPWPCPTLDAIREASER